MAQTDHLPEVDRNRVLRRADWRFLLPNPAPTHSICFAGGMLAEAVHAISGSIIDVSEARGKCDLAVAVDPSRATALAAWQSLAPGGFCYSEWNFPHILGPRDVRRRLMAAGFQDITIYWAWPPPSVSSSLLWLPLESVNPVTYYLQSRPPARRKVTRLARALAGAVWLLLVRIGFIFPLCVVAQKSADSAISYEELDHSSAGGKESFPSAGATDPQTAEAVCTDKPRTGTSRSQRSILLTGGQRSVNKIIRLVFGEGETKPHLAVKYSRVSESNPGLAREAKALHHLSRVQDQTVPGVPRLLFIDDFAGITAVGETVVMGVQLYTVLSKDNFRDLALQATDWLAILARDASLRRSEAWRTRIALPALAEFESGFGRVIEAESLAATRQALASVDSLPLVCEQRDFSPWNVLVAPGGQLAVLDWESSEVEGLPALDLIYFLTYLSFFHDGAMQSGKYAESYLNTLHPDAVTGRVVRECLSRYCRLICLDPHVLRPLRLFVWPLHASSEYRHMTADGGSPPDPMRLATSLFVRLWEQELQTGKELCDAVVTDLDRD